MYRIQKDKTYQIDKFETNFGVAFSAGLIKISNQYPSLTIKTIAI